MATITPSLSTKRDKETKHYEIHIRFCGGVGKVFRAKTGIYVAKEWISTSKRADKFIKDSELNKDQKKASKKFEDLKSHIINAYENSSDDLSSEWLKKEIDKFHNPQKYVEVKPEDLLPKTLKKAVEYYIDGADKRTIKGNHPSAGNVIAPRTLMQHKQTQLRVEEYLKARKKEDIALTDLGESFYDDFILFLKNKKIKHHGIKQSGYAKNTIGTYIKCLKTMLSILPDSSLSGCEFIESKKCPKTYEDVDNIALSERELKQIADCELTGHLDRVRSQFLMLCWSGCRYSDLNKLTKENVINLSNGKAFKLEQQKTKTKVIIPIVEEIEGILEKFNYQLPRALSNQVFNRALKDVCKLAGLNDKVTIERTIGGKKVIETKEKWEVISTHTGRRSFATNMHKRGIPSIALMMLTGHKTESSFLRYIKIDKEDNAKDMLEMMEAWSANQKGGVEK